MSTAIDETIQPTAPEPAAVVDFLATGPVSPTVAQAAIDQQLHSVLAARRFRDSLASHIRQLRQNFNRQHADILDALSEAKADLATKEGVLRDLALIAYRETGARDLGPAIRIRTRTRVRFSEAEALRLARERGFFLKLDRRPFEDYARAFPAEVPFAETECEADVQIAADLARALGGKS